MVKYRFDLPRLMRELGLPMIGAELGVAEGYFSNDLLENGLEKLYMVDAWATLPVRGDGGFPQDWHDRNFLATLARVEKHGNKAVILRGTTLDMAKEVPDDSLGLLHLDASHWYEDVMNDLVTWYPKVVKGGIISGHDFLARQYGVNRAVKEFAKSEVYTIAENKPEDAGFMFIK